MKLFLVLLAAMTAWGQSVSKGTATNRGAATVSGPTSGNLYLAPASLGGSDSNPCTLAQPCLTPQHATAVVTPGQTVYLRGGYYFLSAPWSFGAGNSGTNSAQITYQANGSEAPIVSGGKLIAGTWMVDATVNCGAGCTAYYIDQSGLSNFEVLFYNGVRKARIRTTDALTYLYNAGPITVTASSMGTANTACGCPSGGFDYNGDGGIENCAYLISGTTWQCANKFLYSSTNVPTQPHGLGLGDVEILDFEKWTVSRGRLQSAGSGTAVLNGPMVNSNNQGFIAGHRYLVENVSPKDAGASLRAGEWYVDRCPGCAYNITTPASTWRLYYLAGPNENPNTDEVIVPQQQKIVDATGLKYVTFSGIRFAHDNWQVNQYGLGEQQGLPNVPAGLHFANTTGVVIDRCTIRNTQGLGVEFVGTHGGGVSTGNKVTNSLFYDLGALAMRVGQAPQNGDTDANVPQQVMIQNNEVAWTGQYDATGYGAGVFIGNAHHVTVDHNDIHHTTTGAIEDGFKLGRVQTGSSTSYTHDNWITNNRMWDVGLGLTNDFGGLVYSASSLSPNCPTLGKPTLSPNTYCNHIIGNVASDIVHDVSQPGVPAGNAGDGYNGICIYDDQGTSNVEIQDNTCFRAADSGFFNNMSDRTSDTYDQWNLFQNNVLAAIGTTKSAVHVPIKRGGMNPNSAVLRSNVVAWATSSGSAAIQKPGNWACYDEATPPNPVPCVGMFDFDYDLYWFGSGQSPTFATCKMRGDNSLCGVPQVCGTDYNCATGVSAWAALSGLDTHSLSSTNPVFRSPSTNDYTPTANLAAINFVPFDSSTAGRTSKALNVPVGLIDALPINPLTPSDFSNDGGGPVGSLNPTSLTFSTQPVGVPSVVQTVAFSNSGTSSMFVQSVNVSGDFVQWNNCGTMIEQSWRCTLSVVFTPTATGTRVGTITITDNAPGSPHTITLTGTGSTMSSSENVYCLPNETTTFAGQLDGPAALPTACVYTTMSGTPSPNGVKFSPVTSADFTSALTNAACGDIIELAAGSTYTGKFTLPAKNCDKSHWITVRSSAVNDASFPAEGVRATPCEIGQSSVANYPSYTCANPGARMATIETPAIANMTAVDVTTGANFYRFIGINFAKQNPNYKLGGKIIDLSPGADHIIVDRSLIHGQAWTPSSTANDEVQGAIGANNSTYIAEINGWNYDTYCIAACVDSQGFSGGTGSVQPGPYKLYNNLIASAGESWLWGGGGQFPLATPAARDIEIRRNHSFKPLSWFLPIGTKGAYSLQPITKNLGECKSCERQLVEGNVAENSWGGWQADQTGHAWLASPKNQSVYTSAVVNFSGATATATTGTFTAAQAPPGNDPNQDAPGCPIEPTTGKRRCILKINATGSPLNRQDDNTPYYITTYTDSTHVTLITAPICDANNSCTGVTVFDCQPGKSPDAYAKNLTYRFNEIRNAVDAMEIVTVQSACLDESAGMDSVSVHDMLLNGMDDHNANSDAPYTKVRGFVVSNGQDSGGVIGNLEISHVTNAVYDSQSLTGLATESDFTHTATNPGISMANMKVHDNISPGSWYYQWKSGTNYPGGVSAGLGYGNCVNHVLSDPPDGVNCTWAFAGNVLGLNLFSGSNPPYPSTNQNCGAASCFPDESVANGFTSNFVNWHAGYKGDYHLALTSPYKNAATDASVRLAAGLSLDIGADIDAVLSKTSGVWSGTSYPALTIISAMPNASLTRGLTAAGVSLTVDKSVNAVTRSAGSWISDGITVGMAVTFTGFTNANNNDTFTVTAVTATMLTLDDLNNSLVTETSTTAVTSLGYAQLVPMSAGASPFKVVSCTGNLPPGLAMDRGGRITGAASQAGTYTFTVAVADGAKQTSTGSVSLTVQ